MGTLLISKIREEYPDRMMLVSHAKSTGTSFACPREFPMLACHSTQMNVELNCKTNDVVPCAMQTFSVVPSPKVSNVPLSLPHSHQTSVANLCT